ATAAGASTTRRRLQLSISSTATFIGASKGEHWILRSGWPSATAYHSHFRRCGTVAIAAEIRALGGATSVSTHGRPPTTRLGYRRERRVEDMPFLKASRSTRRGFLGRQRGSDLRQT